MHYFSHILCHRALCPQVTNRARILVPPLPRKIGFNSFFKPFFACRSGCLVQRSMENHFIVAELAVFPGRRPSYLSPSKSALLPPPRAVVDPSRLSSSWRPPGTGGCCGCAGGSSGGIRPGRALAPSIPKKNPILPWLPFCCSGVRKFAVSSCWSKVAFGVCSEI